MSEKAVSHEMYVIGKNIKRLRRLAKLSQKRFGALIGVTHQQVQKYEAGVNRLSVDRLHFLKESLGASYDDFFVGLTDVAGHIEPYIPYEDKKDEVLKERVKTALRELLVDVLT